MSITSSQCRISLFATAALLASANAYAPFGDETARAIAMALQSGAGVGALVSAAVVARRVTGRARWWRLLIIASISGLIVAEVFWWLSGAGTASSPPPAGVAAYFVPPVLSLGALILLSWVHGPHRRAHTTPREYVVVVILDGLIATVAFSILVYLAGLGAMTGDALPRSQNTGTVTAYSLLELIVVVAAVLTAMTYQRGRPSRVNYLLVSGGVVTIAASDRLVTYLGSVGPDSGQLWAGIGFILGPLLIAFGVLELPTSERSEGAMDWVQSTLPYIGFLGIGVLLTFNQLMGASLPMPAAYAAMALVILVTGRQMAAMRAQRVLTRRLYEVQHRLAHQVDHDALTGLPNRVLLARRLDAAISAGTFVLIFVDIDDFKDVNDRFGHAAGDELLRAVGERLRRSVGPGDTLARIGGDEFAILIDGEREAPEVVADRLRVALRDPFAVHGYSVRVRVSMGLVRPVAGEPTPTSDDLLRQADISMYAGKRLGKNTAVVYRPSSSVLVDFPSVLKLSGGGVPPGFSLAYQPVVALPHGTGVAVEALARWTAPNGMQIPPETFVAAAEGAGLGSVLDAMVLALTCREVQQAGLELDIHVNIGAARLGCRDFEKQVARTMADHDIQPGRLVLEITETVPIVDLAEGAAAIRRLKALGVKIALDDFGAGFNSLTYLHALPIDVVKLDRSLAIDDSDRGPALYRSVIGLCDALGLDVIAEGIESTKQADTVYEAGCRFAQGHLFGRAVPIGELGPALSLLREVDVEIANGS
ncbi:MAG: EAL domain-containing protein [Mycobacterium sp.]